ncbi:MAG: ACR3 family arsenite efflux transporter [Planctomycetia bacterium]
MHEPGRRLSFLDRHLTWWILAAIVSGVLLGRFAPQVPMMLGRLAVGDTILPIAVGLIVMMYPPLAKVRYEELGGLARHARLVALSFGLNWIVGPALMYALAIVFLPDRPEYMLGLILVGIARCIAMVLVWNDLADGDREACAGLVAANSLFQIAAFAPLAWFWAKWMPERMGLVGATLDIEMADIATTTAIYLGIPFAAGFASRLLFVRAKGREWYETRFAPAISPLTLVALLFTIVAMFSLQGERILQAPLDALRIAAPLVLYFGLMYAASMWSARRVGAAYPQAATVSLTAASNNFELAIAVAIASFGLQSGQAFAAVVGPLVEVPVLLVLVKLALRAKESWRG